MKTCTKCGEVKPVSEFGKKASKRDGIHPWCKVCNSAAAVAWQTANRDKHNASATKWYFANRESYKAIKVAWHAANPEAGRIYAHNRRASKRKNGGKLSTDLVERLLVLQRGKCACGCKQSLGDDYQLDHMMPLALGGTNTDDNMQLLRKLCNLQKHAKHPIDFMQTRGFLL